MQQCVCVFFLYLFIQSDFKKMKVDQMKFSFSKPNLTIRLILLLNNTKKKKVFPFLLYFRLASKISLSTNKIKNVTDSCVINKSDIYLQL